MFRPLILFLALCSLWINLQAQIGNRPVPDGLPEYEFFPHEDTPEGYFAITAFKSGPLTGLDYANYLIDEDGFVIWCKRLTDEFTFDLDYHPEHHRFTYVYGLVDEITYRVLNDDLEMIEEITVEAPYWADIHDFEILSNGNYLMGFLRDTIMDLSAYTFNGVQGSATTTVLFLALREFDSNLNVVWEWRAIDHISIDEFYDFFSYNPDGMDFTHFNALAETTDGSGDILVSFRHLNAIHRVSRTTGNIVWRLGGAFSDFNFVNDSGFSGQHNVRMLNDSMISLYDNGNMSNPQLSRGLIYELDVANMEATLIRSYGDNIGLYSPAMGSFQVLPGELGLISWGQQLAPLPAVTLINANGEGLSGLTFDFPFQTYRTNFILKDDYSFPDRPGISCTTSLEGEPQLSVEVGWEDYEWSTGATNSTITVDENGYYQYWVNQGDGKLGSYVVEVTDDGVEGCLVTSIDEPVIRSSKKVKAFYNLRGQKLEHRPKGLVYIVLYEDGQAEIKAIID